MRPVLVAAFSSKKANEDTKIAVYIKKDDAVSIKNRQIYFSLSVVNCGSRSNRFPLEAYIAGRRISEFDFPTSSEYVIIYGYIPDNIFKKYNNPCVYIKGSAYFGSNILSNTIPIRPGHG